VQLLLDRPQLGLARGTLTRLPTLVAAATRADQRADRAHAEPKGHRAPDEFAAGDPPALQLADQAFEFLALAHVDSS
jgi:hypothetical protein